MDDRSEDTKYIGSRAQEILHKASIPLTLQETTQGSSSPNSSGITSRKDTLEEPDSQQQDHCGTRSSSSAPVPACSGNKSPFGTYLFTVLMRFSREKAFLNDFYDITLTDGTLDEYAKLTRDDLRSTLAERFPAMSIINRFILEDALWVWMRAVEIVRREERGTV
ncbi:hypothetical protein C8R43DRAFT_942942 [Mycena crocata]|nr:hypothetical protein C8R43DRAFT_942942 [Mycena crocata]